MHQISSDPRVALPVASAPRDAGPLDSVALEREYAEIARKLKGDRPSREIGDARLMSAGALYHGGPAQWSFVPKIFSGRDLRYLAWIAETMGSIMDKLTRRYLEDRELRAKFGFTPALEALTCAPIAYDAQIPVARVDIFLDEETGGFKFCELNTDGSSGMLMTEGASLACLSTRTGRRFAERHDVATFDLYASCAETVLDCYRRARGEADAPVIAAVDYAESIAAEEIEAFRRVFAARGARLRFSDVRDLRYVGGRLSDGLGPIDCVWRRVVVSEMLEKACPGADALKACARDGAVPVVGGFRTWPCATKTVFAVLRDPCAAAFLTERELAFVREHVPATYLLDETSDLGRFCERERWIAKPRDGYNSIGVLAGSDCSRQRWSDVLTAMANSGGTVQEYVTPWASMNVEGGVSGADREPTPYMNMEGLYLFGDRFSGVFTRCGAGAVIGEHTGRLNMGCLVVGDPCS